MTTRTALKATIMDDMHRSSTADGNRVLNEISSAIKFYQSQRFYFNESRSVTFNTVQGTDTYAFPSAITTEMYAIDGAWITIASGDVRELTPEYPADIEEWADEDTTQGEPESYAYINRSLRLWRNPNAVYAVRLMGHVKLAEPLTDGEANNAWMTEAYELLRCRCKRILALHVWKDMELVGRMEIGERDAKNALLDATHDRVAMNVLRATEF